MLVGVTIGDYPYSSDLGRHCYREVGIVSAYHIMGGLSDSNESDSDGYKGVRVPHLQPTMKVNWKLETGR